MSKKNTTARVHFIDGAIRTVLVKDIKHVGDEGARSGTALWDGREIPIYNRVEWGYRWEEQMETHPGECQQCGRVSEMISPTGLCVGCVMEAMIESKEQLL